MSKFHRDTFHVLSAEAMISKDSMAQIQAAENRLDTVFPPAFREWYSYKDALDRLFVYSNDDRPIPLKEWELTSWQGLFLLPFKLENQGICTWSVLLDGTDDPPVYVNVDGDGWQQQTTTFSGYIYSCVWDYAVVFAKAALVQAQNRPVSKSALNILSSKLVEEIRTYGWPGRVQYRFKKGERQAILIWADEDQADWHIAANDEDALIELLEIAWGLDSLGLALYEVTSMGKNVLARFTQ